MKKITILIFALTMVACGINNPKKTAYKDSKDFDLRVKEFACRPLPGNSRRCVCMRAIGLQAFAFTEDCKNVESLILE